MVYALRSVKNPLYRLKTYETVEEWKDDGGEGKIVFETDEITDVTNFRICGKLLFCSPKLAIPEGITSIGRGVFINQEQGIFSAEVNTVNIPASVQTVEEGAFVDTWIDKVKIHPDSLCGIIKDNGFYTRDGKKLLYVLGYTNADDYEYIVPEGTTRIAFDAFMGLTLTLVLPASVTEIGYDAFYKYDYETVTYKAPKGSYGIQYCKEHNLEYEEL